MELRKLNASYLNYGTWWNIDHHEPAVSHGKDLVGDAREEFLMKLCHYTNLRPVYDFIHPSKKYIPLRPDSHS